MVLQAINGVLPTISILQLTWKQQPATWNPDLIVTHCTGDIYGLMIHAVMEPR